ncbi:hypothetical protein J5N97_013604 [Dioscorea zingiberensis]|uniref:Mediator of RNA polymerase II transcription subunit 27 n=1 Tax=Dioscorea zingiberensis TaxID=325984 RepID=A0A9D5CTM1_9LILI|nr:hypothetical protein J5N97_013604 [Dioscorea zingiberensis]
MQQQQSSAVAPAPPQDQPLDSGGGDGTVASEAPPKQVALAMDRLSRIARLIADVRLGADHLLEALFIAADDAPRQQTNKAVQHILKEEASMRHHFHNLRALGRQLEESGVVNGSLKSRGNSWGLHMPLVCPDGAVVAYAWKRQLAGQAGASAVDRTRLALKAFTDQKRRFFPHLEDEPLGQVCDGDVGVAKKHCGSRQLPTFHQEDHSVEKKLSDILTNVVHEVPNMKIFTYQRLDWLKRASSLSPGNVNSLDSSKEQNFINHIKIRPGSVSAATADQVAVIEMLVPSVFRAVVSLHPAGSINPDAVAFFSPDEGGNYVHARGSSVHHVFRHITEHADKALQHFNSMEPNKSFPLLLHWIYNYHTLFSKDCSKCGHLLMMDKSLALLMPPVYHSYRQITTAKFNLVQSTSSTKAHTDDSTAYHIGCYSEEG